MKTIILYIVVLLVFNVLILLLPILIFLLSLTLINVKVFDLFWWLYIPLVLCSPILTLTLGYKIALRKNGISRWLIPALISFVGFSPVWFTYLSISDILSLRDCFLIFITPILLGLTSTALVYVLSVTIRKKNLV